MKNPSEKSVAQIQILTHLAPQGNPRVQKEAEALSAAGFKVRVLTSAPPRATDVIPAKPSEAEQFELVHLQSGDPSVARWRHRWIRLSACFWPKRVRRQVADYGSAFTDLWKVLQKKRQGVLHIVHLEPAFLVGDDLGIWPECCCDLEDWYSNDLLPGSRSRGLLQKIQKAENHALKQSLRCWCPSKAMAEVLVKEYGCQGPVVVRNVFPVKDREGLDGKWKDRPGMAKWMARNDPTVERPEEAPVSIQWFSQTIGPGRGLEFLFQALEGIEGNWELHLRGNLKGYENWLERVCPESVRKRIMLHGLVKNHELPSRNAEHDIGYCGEPCQPANKNLTISNKFFQYLQVGLAVVATTTAGQQEGAREAEGAVQLVCPGNWQGLRQTLKCLLSEREKLKAMRTASWKAGGRLCWENESPKLVRAVEEAWERLSKG